MSMSNPASTFYCQLEAQVLENRNGLEPDCYAALSRYYAAMRNNTDLRPFYRYHWMRRVAPMRALLHSLPIRELPWRILDAGCGVGTEAIFWSTLRSDVQVVGVDASVERLRVACARLPHYARRAPHPLQVSFLNDDVFRILATRQLDLIWVMEAISHVDPAEAFIAQAHAALTPGGYLVISDSNILNPVMAWRELRLRLRGVTHGVAVTTETGAVVQAAAERYFSPGQVKRLLRRNGFSIVSIQMSIFFPPVLARSKLLFALATRLDSVLGRTAGLRIMGGTYTLVAQSV